MDQRKTLPGHCFLFLTKPRVGHIAFNDADGQMNDGLRHTVATHRSSYVVAKRRESRSKDRTVKFTWNRCHNGVFWTLSRETLPAISPLISGPELKRAKEEQTTTRSSDSGTFLALLFQSAPPEAPGPSPHPGHFLDLPTSTTTNLLLTLLLSSPLTAPCFPNNSQTNNHNEDDPRAFILLDPSRGHVTFALKAVENSRTPRNQS
uniref:LAM_G_DOMAIN domain-containing protein n=1 Tax=Steinernema glaseri TaxID=37863 RepID=A0A1I7Y367_9BILA